MTLNIHELVDRFTAIAGRVAAGRDLFFSETIDSLPLTELISQVSLEVPEIKGTGVYTTNVTNPRPDLDPAFLVYQWKGAGYPVILFHHGNNENPFDFGRFSKHSFRMIFEQNSGNIDASIIAVRAPYHGIPLKDYTSKIIHLSHFVEMLAASVVMVEKLVLQLKGKTREKILLSGISLGGWVTNLHRTCFNSANLYVPIFAGAALAEVFLASYYQKLTGENVRDEPDLLRKTLNFEDDYRSRDSENVFPLLARYDQFIKYERQKQCYSDDTIINVIEKGHVTGLLASDKLCNHICSNLQV
jgi:predicted esterase YcpF (UPF0227 family)